jgi:hypothetical protein
VAPSGRSSNHLSGVTKICQVMEKLGCGVHQSSKSKRFCSVPQCSTTRVKGIPFHKFPIESRPRKEWVNALRIGKPVSKYMCVCGLHFAKDAYILPGETVK